MNRLEIIGHIGQDAEVKDLGQNQVINFSVAVSESYLKDNEKKTITTWFECARWGNNTQIAQYLKKGTQVFISGKTNNRAWQNENGEIRVVNGITVNIIELLGSKKENYETVEESKQDTPIEKTPTNKEEDIIDDLPF
jgi:single-strand DNA-binding protein